MIDPNSFVVGVVVGAGLGAAGGAILTVKISRQNKSDSSNKVTIRDVNTLGDVVGRDSSKKD